MITYTSVDAPVELTIDRETSVTCSSVYPAISKPVKYIIAKPTMNPATLEGEVILLSISFLVQLNIAYTTWNIAPAPIARKTTYATGM